MASIGPTVTGVLDAVRAHTEASRHTRSEAVRAAIEHYGQARAERADRADDESDDDE